MNITKRYQVGSRNMDFEGNPFDGVSDLPETMNVMNVNSVASGIIKLLKFDGIKPLPLAPSINGILVLLWRQVLAGNYDFLTA